MSNRLREAIHNAAAGAEEPWRLPRGHIHLDQPVIIRESGIVLRGADGTRHAWFSETAFHAGRSAFLTGRRREPNRPGGVLEIQANRRIFPCCRSRPQGRSLKSSRKRREKLEQPIRAAFRRNSLLSQLRPRRSRSSGDGNLRQWRSLLQHPKNRPPPRRGISSVAGPERHPCAGRLRRETRSRSPRWVPRGPEAKHRQANMDCGRATASSSTRRSRKGGASSSATSASSHFRQYAYEIVEVSDDSITLTQPLRIEFPGRRIICPECGLRRKILASRISPSSSRQSPKHPAPSNQRA